MLAAMNDSKHPYRTLFARNLPNLGPVVGTNVCREALATALLDADPSVREAARDALGELGGKINNHVHYPDEKESKALTP